MSSNRISRRAFVNGSLSALVLASLPARIALGQTTIRIRPEWQQFKSNPNYSSFIDAIRTMRANTNAASRSSWRYWTNVHRNYCPHNIAYFLAWHRGYLFYFEQQLRTVSGNNNLVLPYWNYYQNPTIPAEFTDPASNNPLYVPRINTNVIAALTLAPFNPALWNFERGRTNAFESSIESMPHNPVHNIIGNVMTTLDSPMDPIFYLHHANIDRLWHAWALPDGKGIPAATSAYWAGNFTYAPDLTLPRAQCYHPNRVGTDYVDVTPPSVLPPLGQAARIVRIQAGGGMLNRPPIGSFPAVAPKNLGQDRRSLGGAGGILLGEESVSVRVPIQAADSRSLRAIVASTPSQAGPYQSVQVVLDNVRLLGQGSAGGYFYKVYLNLPQSGDASSSQERYLLGTVGPFELDASAHHGNAGRLEFPATEVLAKLAPDQLNDLTVSLVRVSGQNAPKGRVVAIGELRVEMSSDEPNDTSPQEVKPRDVPYR
jgi:tyrosinase